MFLYHPCRQCFVGKWSHQLINSSTVKHLLFPKDILLGGRGCFQVVPDGLHGLTMWTTLGHILYDLWPGNHPVPPTCVVCNLTKGVNKFSVFFVFLQVSFAFFCLEKSVPIINLWNGDFLGKHTMAQVNIGKVWKTCIPRICKRKCKASRNACRPPSQVKMDQLIQGCVPHVSLPKVRYVQV